MDGWNYLRGLKRGQFCSIHTQQNPSPPISGLNFYSSHKRSLSLNDRITRVSFHDHRRTTLPNFSFLDGSGSGSETTVLHSSNDLMLCTIGFYDFVVCNLTTQKFVVLPKLAVDTSRFKYYVIYDPKKSPYYKVVVVSCANYDLVTSRFAVYSSESGSWKSTVATPGIPNPWLGHGAIWNGAVFWMSCGLGPKSCLKHDHFYFQFDVDAERPTATGVPSPCYSSKGILYFGECGGYLLLIQIPNWYDATEFWVLEIMMDRESKFRWTVKYRVDLKSLPLPPRSVQWVFGDKCYECGSK